MSECHKNVDDYYGCHITVWIPRCAGREAFDGVEPLPEYQKVNEKVFFIIAENRFGNAHNIKSIQNQDFARFEKSLILFTASDYRF